MKRRIGEVRRLERDGDGNPKRGRTLLTLECGHTQELADFPESDEAPVEVDCEECESGAV